MSDHYDTAPKKSKNYKSTLDSQKLNEKEKGGKYIKREREQQKAKHIIRLTSSENSAGIPLC